MKPIDDYHWGVRENLMARFTKRHMSGSGSALGYGLVWLRLKRRYAYSKGDA